MPPPLDDDLPDTFILAYYTYNGIAFKESLSQPFMAQDRDLIRVSIEPLQPVFALAKIEELVITFGELREIQNRWGNCVSLIGPRYGELEPCFSAGEVKIGQRLLEKIRQKQESRQSSGSIASGEVMVRSRALL